jgi:NOL1/NOP2/fmu family ribosome biogenesis protein
MSEKYDFEELDFAVRKMAVMSQFEHDQEKYQNLAKGEWILDVEDSNDGTGDVVLTFPDELLMLNGWKEGTVLNFEVVENKIFVKEVK